MEVYLDHAASSPIKSVALDALVEASLLIGNPSGSHRAARVAKDLLEESREEVATLLGASAGEVVFTSGGTESDNLAIFGSVSEDQLAVCGAIEHHAVLDPVRSMGGKIIGATSSGVIDVEELEDFLKGHGSKVGVVSVMMVNNETGVLQPLGPVLSAVRKFAPHALCHTDAVQAPGYLDVAALARGFDLVSISGHKFGGPKGTGALVVRGTRKIKPVIRGGGQERELRSGTPNLAGIVAMTAALRDAVVNRQENYSKVAHLTQRFRSGISERFGWIRENGGDQPQMQSITSYCFDGLSSEEILFLLDSAGVYASAGSSCASGALEPSHVLLAMGKSKSEANGALRISLGVTSDEEDIDYAVKVIGDVVSNLASKKGIGWG